MNIIEEHKKIMSVQQDTISKMAAYIATLQEDKELLQVNCAEYVNKIEKMLEQVVSLQKLVKEVKEEMNRVKEGQDNKYSPPVLPPGLPQYPNPLYPNPAWPGIWCNTPIGPGLKTEGDGAMYPTTSTRLGDLGAGR